MSTIKKIKTHVLTVSERFPFGHIDAGKPTYFIDKIKSGEKIHTIRGNYELWKKRIDQINAGDAFLSIRTWSGRPYDSPQTRHISTNLVGIQSIERDMLGFFIDGVDNDIQIETLARYDGLTVDQFKSWFKKHDWTQKAAIIHFTNFRY